MKNRKISLIFIFVGFLISCIYSIYIISKFDKNFIGSNGSIQNYIIKGDTKVYFEEADLIQKQLEKNINFLNTGSEYKVSFLYPRLLAIFFYTTDEKIKINDQNNENIEIYNTNNKKLLFLFLQSIFYYFCVYIFFKKVFKIISNKILNILVFFLCFEPTILQFHSHFLTESIYLGLLILLLSFLLDYKKTYKYLIFLGLVIGAMYLQRTVAIFLIFPIIIYFSLKFKRLDILLKSIFFIFIGQMIILTSLGYANYKRSDIFYITPSQTKNTMWWYLHDNIVSSADKNSLTNASQKRLNDKKKWIEDNNINLENERDRLKLYDYYQNYIFKIFKQYPLESIKIITWKTLQSSILDPGMVYSTIGADYTKSKYWEDSIFNFTERIIYSLTIYILSIVGMIYFFRKKDYLIPSLFILFGLYHISVLGWVGASRYSVPSIVCISLIFAQGLVTIKQYFNNKN